MNAETKKFDLNIEKILEDWGKPQAIREIIANAIDEEILSGCRPMEIFVDPSGTWHFRDFGRGLRHEHLTQNESEEKRKNPNVIGKFGIGLKDALATLDREDVKVSISSRYGAMTLGRSEKHGFEDLITLHVYISPPTDPGFQGTEFALFGCSAADVEEAKRMFRRFSGGKAIENTEYGEVLERDGDAAKIYVNGVRVAEEGNFLFSYNITSLTAAIRKALNRERTNVGRSAYTDRVKSILLACGTKEVANRLVENLKGYEDGTQRDELNWLDVSSHAVRILNSVEKVVFFTPDELANDSDLVDRARRDGYNIVAIPTSVKDRISGISDVTGSPILDSREFRSQWNSSFKFDFVSENKMTPKEREVFEKTDDILALAGGRPGMIREVKISRTMRLDPLLSKEVNGLWDEQTGLIIIKRSQLNDLETYAGTLLHEVCHATSGATDVTREFENELTSLSGRMAKRLTGKSPRHLRLLRGRE
jgi:hypothetical protein